MKSPAGPWPGWPHMSMLRSSRSVAPEFESPTVFAVHGLLATPVDEKQGIHVIASNFFLELFFLHRWYLAIVKFVDTRHPGVAYGKLHSMAPALPGVRVFITKARYGLLWSKPEVLAKPSAFCIFADINGNVKGGRGTCTVHSHNLSHPLGFLPA